MPANPPDITAHFRRITTALLIAGFVTAAAAAAAAVEENHPVRITMQTTYGEIQIDVYPDKAPVSADNFLRYVDGGHYDGSSFYRSVRYGNDNGNPKIEVIQGGRSDAKAPFAAIAHETTDQTGIVHTDGVISMARGEVGTASSEFFICIGDQPGLDFGDIRNPDTQGFAAFGKVVSGMDVVRTIHKLPSDAPTDDAYVEGQIIEEPAVIETIRRTR